MKHVAVRKFVTVATMATVLVSAVTVAPALAAQKTPVEAAAYNWTGFYAGVSAGYGWSQDTLSRSGIDPIFSTLVFAFGFVPTSAGVGSRGGLGGITAGYNYQTDRTIYGVETDFSYSGIRGSSQNVHVSLGPADPTVTTLDEKKLDSFGTLRGRVGFLPAPSLLAYVTGGLAYGHAVASTTTTAFDSTGADQCQIGSLGCTAGSTSGLKAGWTLGAGIESIVAHHWSVKAEYLYYDLGRTSYVSTYSSAPLAGRPAAMQTSVRFNGSIVRLGVNYLFD
jgi:outer membrane immunogenic protein